MAGRLYSAFLLVLSFHGITVVQANLQAYGCDEGWTNYEDHCYTVFLGDWNSYSAKNVCMEVGASAVSVWSPVEWAFIASLWQFPQSDNPHLWTGLRGTGGGSWIWEDRSSFSVLQQDTLEYWSVLDPISPVRGSSAGQCMVLTRQGSPALLSCDEIAGGVACKKPLPRIFALSGLLNQSSPEPEGQLDIVHMFQRVLPPVLTAVPSQSGQLLDDLEVTTDNHCAFRCHSISQCQVIELSCVTQYHCGTYRCSLFAGTSI